MVLSKGTNAATLEEALPEVMMRVVSELHDVAYLIEELNRN